MKTTAKTNGCADGARREAPVVLDEALTIVFATALVGYVVKVATKPTASLRELEAMRDIAGLLIFNGACNHIRYSTADTTERITKGALHQIDVLFSGAAKKESIHDENHC